MSDPERLLRSRAVDPEVRGLLQSLRDIAPQHGTAQRTWGRMAARIVALPVLAKATSSAAQIGTNFAVKVLIGALVSTAAGVGAYAVREHAGPARVRVAGVTGASPRSTPVPASPSLVVPPIDEAPAPVPERPNTEPAAPAAPRASTLDEEATLLAHARAELRRGDAHSALVELNRLQGTFPRGQLAQERDVLTVEVLAASGNVAGAKRKARAFIDAHPKSPYSARLARYLEAL